MKLLLAAMIALTLGCSSDDKESDSGSQQQPGYPYPAPLPLYQCNDRSVHYDYYEMVMYNRRRGAVKNCLIVDNRVRENGISPCLFCVSIR